MRERFLIRVGPGPIDPGEALSFVSDPSAGGTALFVGTVRNHSGNGDVSALDYEAWQELAEKKFGDIATQIAERWPVCAVALLHRTGRLDIGEVSVVVACSSPHRAEAFDACRFGIESIKAEAPIWKKEALVSGEGRWVMGS